MTHYWPKYYYSVLLVYNLHKHRSGCSTVGLHFIWINRKCSPLNNNNTQFMFRTRQKIIIISPSKGEGDRTQCTAVPSTIRFRNILFMQIIPPQLQINEWLWKKIKPAVLFNRTEHSQSNSDNSFDSIYSFPLPTMGAPFHSTCHLHCQSSAHTLPGQ